MITPAPRRAGGRKTPEATGRRQQGGLVHAENTGDDIGWLVYNHASPASDNSQTPAPVTDYAFYNRGRLQRNEAIHPMADVAMSFRIEDIHGRGRLWLQATDGRDEFMVRIDPGEKKCTVAKNRQAPAIASRRACPVRCAVRRSMSRFSTGSSFCRSPGGPW